MAARRKPDAEEEPSRVAGGCVLVVLGGVVDAVAWAADEAAGVLLLVAVGVFALWRSARRVSDSSAPPPPGEDRPSCRECAGHTLVSVTPLAGQKGMWIYSSAPPEESNYTHVHIERAADEARA
ncbi:hypothetical protein [Streptomyces asoensis]|uniref:Uncharacterized protein n=1 Tax=Streptomyces asoensis TaxID=249586 RepID=A0ABQ3RYZ6_9ACTN|nr:hypothetical protein [Streptomyces asoensis]GGQ48698.1 hypothetical protein GCM10010496_08720 [Streptomyces asoensis]GHI61064.1 hypothetical protein Saso_27140 [Streptomyces asoensis]